MSKNKYTVYEWINDYEGTGAVASFYKKEEADAFVKKEIDDLVSSGHNADKVKKWYEIEETIEPTEDSRLMCGFLYNRIAFIESISRTELCEELKSLATVFENDSDKRISSYVIEKDYVKAVISGVNRKLKGDWEISVKFYEKDMEGLSIDSNGMWHTTSYDDEERIVRQDFGDGSWVRYMYSKDNTHQVKVYSDGKVSLYKVDENGIESDYVE